eukprot:7214379-Prymnesium_polylepis.1
MAACQAGHIGCVATLLVGGASPGTVRKNGWTALMEACFAGHVECACLLLSARAEPSQASPTGTTALMAACQAGHASCAETLLRRGAEADARRENGWTALMAACQAGHDGCAQLLLEHGASPDHSTSDGVTALIVACSQGWPDIAKLLSFSGAARTRTRSGLTPAEVAAHFGHDDVAAFLDLSAAWTTRLHHLALLTPCRTRELLRAGADVHARAGAGAVSPCEIAQQLADAGHGPPGSPAALVLAAASPWSPSTHTLFAAAQRGRAFELLRLGHLLSKQERFDGASGALLDIWLGHVMPHAIERGAPDACEPEPEGGVLAPRSDANAVGAEA